MQPNLGTLSPEPYSQMPGLNQTRGSFWDDEGGISSHHAVPSALGLSAPCFRAINSAKTVLRIARVVGGHDAQSMAEFRSRDSVAEMITSKAQGRPAKVGWWAPWRVGIIRTGQSWQGDLWMQDPEPGPIADSRSARLGAKMTALSKHFLCAHSPPSHPPVIQALCKNAQLGAAARQKSTDELMESRDHLVTISCLYSRPIFHFGSFACNWVPS